MNRILLLLFAIISLLVLGGCENESKSNEKSLEDATEERKDEITSIISESALNEYIEGNIEYEQYDTITDDDKTVFMYNVLLPISSSYLELDSSEQYVKFRDAAQEIFNFQGDDNRLGMAKGNPIANADGERIKFQSLILIFGDNKNDTFKISLDNEKVRAIRIDNEGKIENVIFATISNEKYVIFESGTILREGEYEIEGEWAFRKSDSGSGGQSTKNTTTNKNDWASLSQSEKYSKVSSYMQQIENEGYSIFVNEGYFVDALDAYYDGGYTNNTSIKEAMVLVGLSGGGISK